MDAPKFVCDDCKKEFSLQPVNIRTARVNIKEKDCIVRYFICPNCSRVYVFMFLQFSDMALVFSEQNIFTQYQASLSYKNKTLSKRLYSRYYSLKQLLEDKMKKLMSAYPNGFVYDKENETISYRENTTE